MTLLLQKASALDAMRLAAHLDSEQCETRNSFVTHGQIMADGVIRLRWRRDPAGYQLKEIGPHGPKRGDSQIISSVSPAGIYVTGLSGAAEDFELSVCQHNIFIDLANAGDEKGALSFHNKWGLLSRSQ